MTDVRYDRAPGDIPREETQAWALSEALIYTIGLLVALILTATSFWVANTSLLWQGGVGLGPAVLAIAQMGIHLVFFLHITTGPDSTNNILALAFGLLIVFVVVAGSMWIMADMNQNMLMPSAEPMASPRGSRSRSSVKSVPH
jgi:cytochrome o ubiquinol oxidase operon protein cyoD